jgi:beta-1,4-mannosyltransferase
MTAKKQKQHEHSKLHVVVVVLGDVGRSPRMQYHALSLVKAQHTVTLVGYTGEEVIAELENQELLNLVRFRVPVPKLLQQKVLLPIYYLWRIASLSWYLFYNLLSIPTSIDCILVQNPPAIPLLVIAWFVCRLRNASLVIDWHNLGYTMIDSTSSRVGKVARPIAQLYEHYMAPLADGHLAVTKAMKEFLKREMHVDARVLYDCPPALFRPLSLEEKHAFLLELNTELSKSCPNSWTLLAQNQTLLTEVLADGQVRYRPNRPKLLTSSTSWTPDEDFGILLDALVELDTKLLIKNQRLLVVVTGKGPQKEYYQQKLSRLTLTNVCIQTLWLEPRDYPRMIACADVGVSLHASTSGLDFPMKVHDHFGCHVPVLVKQFDCASELLHDRVNGRIFATSHELAVLTGELLLTGEEGDKELRRYVRALGDRPRWDENWTQHAWPVIEMATTKTHEERATLVV